MSPLHEQPWPAITSELPEAGGTPAEAEDGTPATGNRAESVTRPAPISEPAPGTVLATGIDTLDLGLFVDWSAVPELFDHFEPIKLAAKGGPGLLVEPWQAVVLPSGKAPIYAYHLRVPEGQLYLARQIVPRGQTPNVLVSLSAASLWQLGPAGALEAMRQWMTARGGRVLEERISRVDLCCDLYLPEGMSAEFLQTHQVTPFHTVNIHQQLNRLETYYCGSGKGPVRIRIYDKGQEIQAKGDKFWFQEIWGTPGVRHVWRVEFQLRRALIKSFQINSLADLQQQAAALWRKLTTDWFSLRDRTASTNISRCPPLPIWSSVQQAAERFGPESTLQRVRQTVLPAVDWYIAHIAGCTVSYAARLRLPEQEQALATLLQDLQNYWQSHDWRGTFARKAIEQGYAPPASEAAVGEGL